MLQTNLTPAEMDKELLRQAEQVKQTLNEHGWKTIIEPLLDKMIEDVVGAKRDGRWDAGSFGGCAQIQFGGMSGRAPSLHLSPENLMWYRQGLIDFQNRVLDIVEAGDKAKERMKAVATEIPEKPNIPMLDSQYAPGDNASSFSRYEILDDDSNGGLNT